MTRMNTSTVAFAMKRSLLSLIVMHWGHNCAFDNLI
uniref:Uncharacterized protein n=1 Tax=Rhizophora mucronata TaxID=61149 RepID=A0A2P2QEN9_RHIMU